MSRPLSGLSSTMAGPESPPFAQPSRESSRNAPFTFSSAPWHSKHRCVSSGRIFFSKNSIRSSAAAAPEPTKSAVRASGSVGRNRIVRDGPRPEVIVGNYPGRATNFSAPSQHRDETEVSLGKNRSHGRSQTDGKRLLSIRRKRAHQSFRSPSTVKGSAVVADKNNLTTPFGALSAHDPFRRERGSGGHTATSSAVGGRLQGCDGDVQPTGGTVEV